MTINKENDGQSELQQAVHKDSLSEEYAKNYVNEDLHPALADFGITYDSKNDRFAAEVEETYDEATLFDNQRAFAEALEEFQKGVDTKYKSQIDLQRTQTWSDVMEKVEKARAEYIGVGKTGIVKRIDNKLRTFQTAAPAIEAWLRLLPSTTIYGSIICGGLTIILEVGVDEQHSHGRG